jgi:hypothetical protein
MVASVEIAYVVRDTAADHPGLTAPARIIGMRSQGEAEIAIEQGETRYEGVTWTTRRQLASNQLVPLPEPARRGLINLADDVVATTNQAVAASAQLDPSDVTRSTRFGQRAHLGRSAQSHQNWTSPTTSTVVGSSHSTRAFLCTHWALFRGPAHPAALVKALALRSPMRAPWSLEWTSAYQRSYLVALRDAGRRNRAMSLPRLAMNSARPSLVAA